MSKNKIIFLSIFLPFAVFPQNNEPTIKLDLPLFDLPYQIDAMNTVGQGFFSSYANPSMAQSSALAMDLYSAFHFGVKALFDQWNFNDTLGLWEMKGLIQDISLLAGNLLLVYVPGGSGWMHEEFHRAVMSRYTVNSFNDMNTFPLGQEMVYVKSVKDEDLERFKAESPADFVRLPAAGIEGEYLLIDQLQRNSFFYNQGLRFHTFYWLTTINAHGYISLSGNINGHDTLDAQETDILSRDFTGMDMAAWVYDLFRPDEPYHKRGEHSTGIGIDRYRTTEDLTGEELDYLRAQKYWHIFNYISPMLLNINRIALGDTGMYGNFAFRHVLTSFGTDVALNMYVLKDRFNIVFVLHNYLNYKNYFPSIEVALVDFPLSSGSLKVYLSPRILVGMQPENQKFKTETPEFLGLAGCRIDLNISKFFLPYFDVTVKTDGWVTGSEFLEKNISIKTGISLRF
ncbi:MAG: hypothetical protein LBD74_08275 [Spirochaetaceae bacterium]|nr:hypothetical protein [Spirochaetaceae bacterium]